MTRRMMGAMDNRKTRPCLAERRDAGKQVPGYQRTSAAFGSGYVIAWTFV